MELLYIWIQKYGGIADVSLNFSNQYRFVFDAKENTLIVKSTEFYIPNFFSENITNLTGIIGANGAGKTSVLRYVIEHCTDGIHNHEAKGTIIVYKSAQKFYYYTSIGLNLGGLPVTELFERVHDLDRFKSATSAVYLSNHFDPTSYYAEDYTRTNYGETKNVSTWYLLYSDYQTKTGQDANNRALTFDQKFEAFASMEFMRMVKVLRWINRRKERDSFPVQMPPYLNLKLNFNQDTISNKAFSELSQKFQAYFSVKQSSKNLFLLRAFEAAIYHFIDEQKFAVGPMQITSLYEKIFQSISEYLSTHKYSDHPNASIVYEINSIIKNVVRQMELSIFRERLEKIQSFLNQLDHFISGRYSRVDQSGSVLGISIKNVNLGLLTGLIDEYYNVEKIGEYADFYFSHQFFSASSLSSGEYTFLSVFGRLNNLKFEKKKSILLLIDEAELTLHPQWQKMFISLFIDFISENFKQNKVQVILTSHSPFILSDLPPNCVILLKKEGGKTVVVDSLDKRNETFGANVHELFTDSFFLQDGLIGEFARRKIENLVTKVNEKDRYTLAEYNSFKKEIDIIGEPYVRFKLLEKIMTGLPNEAFDNVIVEREKELELLRRIRNDKN